MAAYQAQRRKKSLLLYFKTEEEKARFEQIAALAGYGNDFSGWARQQLHHATSGHLYPPGYVDGLKADLAKLTERHDAAREEAEDYREQLRQLQAEHKTALLLLAGLPNGPEAIKRHFPTNGPAQAVSA